MQKNVALAKIGKSRHQSIWPGKVEQIYLTICTNILCDLNKYLLQFEQIFKIVVRWQKSVKVGISQFGPATAYFSVSLHLITIDIYCI